MPAFITLLQRAKVPRAFMMPCPAKTAASALYVAFVQRHDCSARRMAVERTPTLVLAKVRVPSGVVDKRECFRACGAWCGK